MTAAPPQTQTEPPETDDFGLNLIFNDPSTSISHPASSASGLAPKSGKVKRKTKYDRRREKSRQAKLAKLESKENAPKKEYGNDSSNLRRSGSSNKGVENEPAGETSGEDVSKSKHASTADENSIRKEKAEKAHSTSGPSIDAANESQPKAASFVDDEEGASKNDGAPKIKHMGAIEASENAGQSSSKETPNNATKNTPILQNNTVQFSGQEDQGPKSLSRKSRVQIPITFEQKSKYLSEFHARPRDLDREERASTMIKVSEASDHIFAAVEDDDDENNGAYDGMDGENSERDEEDKEKNNRERRSEKLHASSSTKTTAKSTTCPFEKLGLHSNIVTTLTSPTGNFQLKQPTIIQSRSVSALLYGGKRENGGNHKKKKNGNGKMEENLFIQSETGSGKTLAYLLPILQQLALDPRTQNPKKIDRLQSGTRAILLAPTRELATQIYTTATQLCSHSFPWIVPGCFSGGEKRKSEKARLRKGITILIATPGRLLDHLCKTESLLTALKGKLEWLVLDEADRLLDAGLGGQVEQIVQHLRSNQPGSGRKKDGVTWRSVLVSATVTSEMEKLGETVLGGEGWMWARGHKSNAGGKMVEKFKARIVEGGEEPSNEAEENDASQTDTKLAQHELDNAAPRQLAQLYMVVNAKLRLSSLVGFLAARAANKERTVVFMSTCDSVDYHHALFAAMESILPQDETDRNDDAKSAGIFGKHCPIYKLHGDIPHSQRLATLKKFSGSSQNSKQSQNSAILLATDVAARGLNFPSLDWIVQYDPPCETKDYVHRAGRSARAGKAGHALLFLLPSERQYVEVLQLRGLKEISPLSLSSTLTKAAEICKGVASEGEEKAKGNTFSDGKGEAFTSAIQNRLEQCVLQNDADYKASIDQKVKDKKQRRKSRKDAAGPLLEGARLAFSAFVRAYPAKEKAVRHIFNARALHLGHIARSLALKETPKMVSKVNSNVSTYTEDGEEKGAKESSKGEKRKSRLAFESKKLEERGDSTQDDNGVGIDDGENERNMSLLGGVLGVAKTGRTKSPANKKLKTSSTGSNSTKDVHKRMMEAARLMQSQGMEFM